MKDKRYFIGILGIVSVLLIVMGITLAVFSYVGTGTKVNQVTTGTITMVYKEGNNRISITDAVPMNDATGRVLSNVSDGDNNVFDFTVGVNITGNQSIDYEITAEKIVAGENASTLDNNEVRIYLEKSNDGTTYTPIISRTNPNYFTPIDSSNAAEYDSFGASNTEMLLDNGTMNTTQEVHYRLRMWIADTYVMSGTSKRFTLKVNVYGK